MGGADYRGKSATGSPKSGMPSGRQWITWARVWRFGSFSGSVPEAGELREGWGVMERHDARW